MANPYTLFRELIAGPPLLIGQVLSIGTGTALGSVAVELWGGAIINCRGEAEVGTSVFVRDGVIEGKAPSLTVEEIEL